MIYTRPQLRSSQHFFERVSDELSVSGLIRLPGKPLEGAPLLVAVPGGSYTSSYFDIGNCSLLERAAAVGLATLALDRPGYGSTTSLPPAEASIARNAEQLDRALAQLHQLPGVDYTAGVVLIGHSIGAAIAVNLAARQPSWPLLGIALSGIGLTAPPEIGAAWSSLPDIPMVSVPPEAKDALMFGPTWTYEPRIPALARAANAPTPRTELIDIVSRWPNAMPELAREVTVPVHYRQAEFDRLWLADSSELERFAAAFTTAPFVDARRCDAVGHCIDFHRDGASFQLEQIAFALRCATRHWRPAPSVAPHLHQIPA